MKLTYKMFMAESFQITMTPICVEECKLFSECYWPNLKTVSLSNHYRYRRYFASDQRGALYHSSKVEEC